MTLRRREAGLRDMFQRVMLVSLAASTAGAACRAAESTDGSPDATTAADEAGLVADVTVADETTVPVFDANLPDFGFTWCDAGPPQSYDARAIFDADGGICDFYSRVPCGLPPGVKTGVYGDLTRVDCTTVCTTDAAVLSCYVLDATDFKNLPDAPTIIMECATCLGGGRRPRGLRAPALRGGKKTGLVGEYLARMAHLEAASVHAFRRLGAELRAFGAPRELVRAAARSARDEVRHAATAQRLARRYGAGTERASVRGAPRRSLKAMAVENVVEGCVRETFGALVATWQADRARDADVASAMRSIAADETRHAALAWSVAAWVDGRLDAAGRARLARARCTAVAALRAELRVPVAPALVTALGLPDVRQALAFIDTLETALWGLPGELPPRGNHAPT